MGNTAIEKMNVCGDLYGVGLTNAIKECDEESFVQVIKQLDALGTIDARKVFTKSDLIEALSEISEQEKFDAAESLNNGTFFD